MHCSKRLSLITLICGSLLAGQAAATVNILGLDDMSCEGWAQAKDDSELRNLYVGWVRGFLTGYNYGQQSQQVSTISSNSVALYLRDYCRLNPKGQIDDGAMRLSDRFSGRNQPLRK